MIIVGDPNEDLLNVSFHNLQEILIINSLQNVIAEPTRGRALLDPVIVADDCVVYNAGTICNPSDISDHKATYLYIPHDYTMSSAFKRTVWLYNRANFTELNDKISTFNWNCLNDGTVDEASLLFMTVFMQFIKTTIPHKEVTIRPQDKPWYDSEIRKLYRKRDRQRKKAINSSNQPDWLRYVNNLKKHAKERFYNNLEISLLDSFTN
ncbi:MAG: hypothetical protein AB2708_17895, partial [Candidatus Thiodiazotropha taylori]